jgi:predicted O-methyltransferase YrrM
MSEQLLDCHYIHTRKDPMKFGQIYGQVGGYALMSKYKARTLYDFVLREKPKTVYEMGTHRGGSALIMAAALHELGRGEVTTFDFAEVRALVPNAETLIKESKLGGYVSVAYCDWCFEWELGKLLELQRSSVKKNAKVVDFVYIDGGHYWTSTALTFYLITSLLRPGGWVLFDDLDWVIDKHESKESTYAKRISAEARKCPIVRMVFDLLVRTSSSYHNFRVTAKGSWGWAQKKA